MNRPYPEKPQQYEPRIELALQAVAHAVQGIDYLMAFLLRQQSPRWRRQGNCFDLAAKEFREACRWLDKPDRPKSAARTSRTQLGKLPP